MIAHGIAAVLVLSQPSPKLMPARYEPARGCYIGAYIELDPVVKDDIAAFEHLVGKKHATYFHYVGYGRPFPFKWVRQLKAGGYVPHIAWEPNEGLEAVRDDDYLRGWAEAARHAGVPIFLRFASEMNGTWQAWSGNPELYIEKWRLVYRVMHEVAPNVVMIWCPFATPRATIPMYYPGDEYVDWVGVNIYSVLRHDGQPNKIGGEDPRDLLRPIYQAFASRKPIAICEYGATHYCVATKQRATDFAVKSMRSLYSSLPTEFPRVKMINWFSVDAATSGLAHNDYALTTDQRVLGTYRELIADDYFLSAVAKSAPTPIASAANRATQAQPVQEAQRPLSPLPRGVPLAGTSLGQSTDRIAIAVIGAPPDHVRGRVRVAVAIPQNLTGMMVTIYLDDRIRAIGNMPPYSFPLDADRLSPGVHVVRVSVADSSEQVVAEARAAFVVASKESLNNKTDSRQ